MWISQSGISDISDMYAGNPPTVALLMIPLTIFSPEIAQSLWLILNVGILGLCAWLAGKLCAPRNPTGRLWIIAVFALLVSVGETLRYGQVYLLLALLSLIGFAAAQKRRDVLAGIAIAGMLLLKPYYGVLCLGLLIWSRRPRSIIVALAAAVSIVIGTLPFLASTWSGFLAAEASVNSVPWAGIPAEQTLNGLIQHLFLYTPTWNPEPLIDLPWLAISLRYGLLIILVAVTLWQACKHDPLWLWAPALVLMPILAPVGEVHHYTVLLLPIAVGITCLVERKTNRLTTSMIGAALLLLTVPWPSLHSEMGWGGWNGLLAYPRLMGGLLLWAGLTLGWQMAS